MNTTTCCHRNDFRDVFQPRNSFAIGIASNGTHSLTNRSRCIGRFNSFSISRRPPRTSCQLSRFNVQRRIGYQNESTKIKQENYCKDKYIIFLVAPHYYNSVLSHICLPFQAEKQWQRFKGSTHSIVADVLGSEDTESIFIPWTCLATTIIQLKPQK